MRRVVRQLLRRRRAQSQEVSTQSDEVQVGPEQSDPVQSDPVQSDPVQSNPVQSEPLQPEPSQPQPVHSHTVQVGPSSSAPPQSNTGDFNSLGFAQRALANVDPKLAALAKRYLKEHKKWLATQFRADLLKALNYQKRAFESIKLEHCFGLGSLWEPHRNKDWQCFTTRAIQLACLIDVVAYLEHTSTDRYPIHIFAQDPSFHEEDCSLLGSFNVISTTHPESLQPHTDATTFFYSPHGYYTPSLIPVFSSKDHLERLRGPPILLTTDSENAVFSGTMKAINAHYRKHEMSSWETLNMNEEAEKTDYWLAFVNMRLWIRQDLYQAPVLSTQRVGVERLGLKHGFYGPRPTK